MWAQHPSVRLTRSISRSTNLRDCLHAVQRGHVPALGPQVSLGPYTFLLAHLEARRGAAGACVRACTDFFFFLRAMCFLRLLTRLYTYTPQRPIDRCLLWWRSSSCSEACVDLCRTTRNPDLPIPVAQPSIALHASVRYPIAADNEASL
jgi:hypothetical protein